MYYLLFVLFTYAGDKHKSHVIICSLLFNSYMTGVTSGAGTVYLSRPPDVSPLISGFVFLVFRVMFCGSLCVSFIFDLVHCIISSCMTSSSR